MDEVIMEKEPLKEQSKFKNQQYSRRVSGDNENKPYKIICSKKNLEVT